MKQPKDTFIRNTVWCAILLIIFGLLTGVFKGNFTTWFCFTFLCVVGVFNFLYSRMDETKKPPQ